MITAKEIQVWICSDPKCTGIHIRLFDEDDDEYAQFVIPIDYLDEHISSLRNAESLVKGKTEH